MSVLINVWVDKHAELLERLFIRITRVEPIAAILSELTNFQPITFPNDDADPNVKSLQLIVSNFIPMVRFFYNALTNLQYLNKIHLGLIVDQLLWPTRKSVTRPVILQTLNNSSIADSVLMIVGTMQFMRSIGYTVSNFFYSALTLKCRMIMDTEKTVTQRSTANLALLQSLETAVLPYRQDTVPMIVGELKQLELVQRVFMDISDANPEALHLLLNGEQEFKMEWKRVRPEDMRQVDNPYAGFSTVGKYNWVIMQKLVNLVLNGNKNDFLTMFADVFSDGDFVAPVLIDTISEMKTELQSELKSYVQYTLNPKRPPNNLNNEIVGRWSKFYTAFVQNENKQIRALTRRNAPRVSFDTVTIMKFRLDKRTYDRIGNFGYTRVGASAYPSLFIGGRCWRRDKSDVWLDEMDNEKDMVYASEPFPIMYQALWPTLITYLWSVLVPDSKDPRRAIRLFNAVREDGLADVQKLCLVSYRHWAQVKLFLLSKGAQQKPQFKLADVTVENCVNGQNALGIAETIRNFQAQQLKRLRDNGWTENGPKRIPIPGFDEAVRNMVKVSGKMVPRQTQIDESNSKTARRTPKTVEREQAPKTVEREQAQNYMDEKHVDVPTPMETSRITKFEDVVNRLETEKKTREDEYAEDNTIAFRRMFGEPRRQRNTTVMDDNGEAFNRLFNERVPVQELGSWDQKYCAAVGCVKRLYLDEQKEVDCERDDRYGFVVLKTLSDEAITDGQRNLLRLLRDIVDGFENGNVAWMLDIQLPDQLPAYCSVSIQKLVQEIQERANENLATAADETLADLNQGMREDRASDIRHRERMENLARTRWKKKVTQAKLGRKKNVQPERKMRPFGPRRAVFDADEDNFGNVISVDRNYVMVDDPTRMDTSVFSRNFRQPPQDEEKKSSEMDQLNISQLDDDDVVEFDAAEDLEDKEADNPEPRQSTSQSGVTPDPLSQAQGTLEWAQMDPDKAKPISLYWQGTSGSHWTIDMVRQEIKPIQLLNQNRATIGNVVFWNIEKDAFQSPFMISQYFWDFSQVTRNNTTPIARELTGEQNFWQTQPDYYPEKGDRNILAQMYNFVNNLVLEGYCNQDNRHFLTWYVIQWLWFEGIEDAWEQFSNASRFQSNTVLGEEGYQLAGRIMSVIMMVNLSNMFVPFLKLPTDVTGERDFDDKLNAFFPPKDTMRQPWALMFRDFVGRAFVRMSPQVGGGISQVVPMLNDTLGYQQGILQEFRIKNLDNAIETFHAFDDSPLALTIQNVRWLMLQNLCESPVNFQFLTKNLQQTINSIKDGRLRKIYNRELIVRCADEGSFVGLTAFGDLSCADGEKWMIRDLPVPMITPTMAVFMTMIDREFYKGCRWEAVNDGRTRNMHLMHIVRWLGMPACLSLLNGKDWKRMNKIWSKRAFGRVPKPDIALVKMLQWVLNAPDVYPFSYGDVGGDLTRPNSVLVSLDHTVPQAILLTFNKDAIRQRKRLLRPKFAKRADFYQNDDKTPVYVDIEEPYDKDYDIVRDFFFPDEQNIGLSPEEFMALGNAYNAVVEALENIGNKIRFDSNTLNWEDNYLRDQIDELKDNVMAGDDITQNVDLIVGRLNPVTPVLDSDSSSDYDENEFQDFANSEDTKHNSPGARVNANGQTTRATLDDEEKIPDNIPEPYAPVQQNSGQQGVQNVAREENDEDAIHKRVTIRDIVRQMSSLKRTRRFKVSTSLIEMAARMESYQKFGAVWIRDMSLYRILLQALGGEFRQDTPLARHLQSLTPKGLTGRRMGEWQNVIRLTLDANPDSGRGMSAICVRGTVPRMVAYIESAIKCETMKDWMLQQPLLRKDTVDGIIQAQSPSVYTFINDFAVPRWTKFSWNSMKDVERLTNFVNWLPLDCYRKIKDVVQPIIIRRRNFGASQKKDRYKVKANWSEKWMASCPIAGLIDVLMNSDNAPWFKYFFNQYNRERLATLYNDSMCVVSYDTTHPGNFLITTKVGGSIRTESISAEDEFGIFLNNRYMPPQLGIFIATTMRTGKVPIDHDTDLGNSQQIINSRRAYLQRIYDMIDSIDASYIASQRLSTSTFSMFVMELLGLLNISSDRPLVNSMEEFYTEEDGEDLRRLATRFENFIAADKTAAGATGALAGMTALAFLGAPAVLGGGAIAGIGSLFGGAAAGVGLQEVYQRLPDGATWAQWLDSGKASLKAAYRSTTAFAFRNEEEKLAILRERYRQMKRAGKSQVTESLARVEPLLFGKSQVLASTQAALIRKILGIFVATRVQSIVMGEFASTRSASELAAADRFKMAGAVYDKYLHYGLGFSESLSDGNRVAIMQARDTLIRDLLASRGPLQSGLRARYRQFVTDGTSVTFDRALSRYGDINYARELVQQKRRENIPLTEDEAKFAQSQGILMDPNAPSFVSAAELEQVRQVNRDVMKGVEPENLQCEDTGRTPGFEMDPNGQLVRRCWEESKPWISSKNIDPSKLQQLSQKNRVILQLLREFMGKEWTPTTDHTLNLFKWLGVNCLEFDQAQQFFTNEINRRNGRVQLVVPVNSDVYPSCVARLRFLYHTLNSSIVFPFVSDSKQAEAIAARLPYKVVTFVSWKRSGQLVMMRYLPHQRRTETQETQAESLLDGNMDAFPQSLLRLAVFKLFNGGLCASNVVLFRQRMQRTRKYDKRVNMRVVALGEVLPMRDAQRLMSAYQTKNMGQFNRLKKKSHEIQAGNLTVGDIAILEAIFNEEDRSGRENPRRQMERLAQFSTTARDSNIDEEADRYVLTQLYMEPKFISELRRIYISRTGASPGKVSKMTGKEMYKDLMGGDINVEQRPLSAYDINPYVIPNPAWIGANGVLDVMSGNDKMRKDAYLIQRFGVSYDDVAEATRKVERNNNAQQLKDFKQQFAKDETDADDLNTLRENMSRRCAPEAKASGWCTGSVSKILNQIRAGLCNPRVRLISSELKMLKQWEEALMAMVNSGKLNKRVRLRNRRNLSKYQQTCRSLDQLMRAVIPTESNGGRLQYGDILSGAGGADQLNLRYFGGQWKDRGINWRQAMSMYLQQAQPGDLSTFAIMVLFQIGFNEGVFGLREPVEKNEVPTGWRAWLSSVIE